MGLKYEGAALESVINDDIYKLLYIAYLRSENCLPFRRRVQIARGLSDANILINQCLAEGFNDE